MPGVPKIGVAMEPWLSQLNAGHSDAAWDLFVERYRRLALATIRRLVHDHDDVMDVFSSVCAALHANDLARLRHYVNRSAHNARFSTWLVVVVRHLTIDWLRERDGRYRPVIPTELSQMQREIYRAVFLDGRSHREAYELIASRASTAIDFSSFLREVRETYRRARVLPMMPKRDAATSICNADELASDAGDPVHSVEQADAARHVADGLAPIAPDVRVAIELLVIERMAAADIARVLGWPNAKAVYNRVYRALDSVRATLERAGIRRQDL